MVLVEPAFVDATSSGRVALEGDIHYVIWSQTGKRLAALAAEARSDEIIFAAGTGYKVLRIDAGPGPGRATVFLREFALPRGVSVALNAQPPAPPIEPLEEADSRVLERLAAAAVLHDEATAEVLARRAGSTVPPIGLSSGSVPFYAMTPGN